MARNQIPFETLDSIIDQADLYFTTPGDRVEDGDECASIRPTYRGRGYRAEGFGLVIGSESVLRVILTAAGLIAKEQEHDDAEDVLDSLSFARAVETDQMGRDSIIAYWPDWEITDLPEIYTKD